VVDNASTDGSAQAIAREFPCVHVIRNDRNIGFGPANNQAIRLALGAHILLLNSDAFVKPGAVEKLIAYMEKHPQVGALGPRLLNADGTLQRSCHRFPSPSRAWLENLWISSLFPNHPSLGGYGKWDHNSERFVDFVSGACLLLRRTVCEQTGGFDEMFFMYAEETDLQLRLRRKGWLVGFTPEAQVVHLGGASSGAAGIRRHVFDGLDRYQYKHHGLPGLLSVRAAMAIGNALRAGAWAAVLLCFPKRRNHALAKLKLSVWLFLRQTMHWRGILTK